VGIDSADLPQISRLMALVGVCEYWGNPELDPFRVGDVYSLHAGLTTTTVVSRHILHDIRLLSISDRLSRILFYGNYLTTMLLLVGMGMQGNTANSEARRAEQRTECNILYYVESSLAPATRNNIQTCALSSQQSEPRSTIQHNPPWNHEMII
jgi:hypothetical protein